MSTQFFRAVFALQILIGLFGKPLGVPVECDLPPDQKCNGQSKKAPEITAPDKEQRGKHHCIVPVIDPAYGAAFVLHEPALERAEKQNADHITDRIDAA